MLFSYIITGIVTDLTFRIAWWMAKQVAYKSITTITYAIVPYAMVPFAYEKKVNL